MLAVHLLRLMSMPVRGVGDSTKMMQPGSGQAATHVPGGGTGVVLAENECQAQDTPGGAPSVPSEHSLYITLVVITFS